MTIFLELPAEMKEQLWAHLLQNRTEQVAIVFAAVERNDDTTIFTARDAYLATPDDFDFHSEFHIELTDDARARIIKRAWDTGTSPVELHSHPGDWWGAMFSASDMVGFSEYVPHCRWRLRNQPYLAIVVTPAGMDALAWIGNAKEPVGLDAMRIDGSGAIMPTHQSTTHLNANGDPYGPRTI